MRNDYRSAAFVPTKILENRAPTCIFPVVAPAKKTSEKYAALSHRTAGVVTRIHPRLVQAAQAIWDHPELPFHERDTSALIVQMLRDEGFVVSHGVGNLDTAFIAEGGSTDFGAPVIVLCVEMDANTGLSDKPMGVAHACGHNLSAMVSVGAAVALLAVAKEAGIRIRVVGTPAEHGGAGKVPLLKAGAFDGAGAVAMSHASGIDRAEMRTLSTESFDVRFAGVGAHGMDAVAGRNAFNAATKTYERLGGFRKPQGIPPGSMELSVNTRGPNNVVRAAAVLSVTLRHLSRDFINRTLWPRVAKAAVDVAEKHGVGVTAIRRGLPYQKVITDPAFARAYMDAGLELEERQIVEPVRRTDLRASTDLGFLTGTESTPGMAGLHTMFSVGEPDLPLHSRRMWLAGSPRDNPKAAFAIRQCAEMLARSVLMVALSNDRDRLAGRKWSEVINVNVESSAPSDNPIPVHVRLLRPEPGTDQDVMAQAMTDGPSEMFPFGGNYPPSITRLQDRALKMGLS